MPMYLCSVDRTMPSSTSSRASSSVIPLLNGCKIQDIQLSDDDGVSQAPFERRLGIQSLPYELLRRIFIIGANLTYPYASSPFLFKTDGNYNARPSWDFQVSASLVNRTWRKIALDTPSLWNIIHFRTHAHIARAKEFIARCSRRSATYPIDILIETVAVGDYAPPENLFAGELEEIFAFISTQIEMWRSFHLKVRCDECKLVARRYLGIVCDGAPQLETWQLYHFEDFPTADALHLATHRPTVVCFKDDYPKLKNVSMIGVNLPWERTNLRNLDQLELALHRPMTRPVYDEWKRMLENSPQLRTLVLHYSGPQPEPAPGEPMMETNVWPRRNECLSIGSLEVLDLVDLDADYLCGFIRHLAFPGLKCLSLTFPEEEQDYTSFFHLAATNGVSPFPMLAGLQALSLTAFVCDKDSLRAFLRLLVGLDTFEVNFRYVPEHLFELLLEGVPVQVHVPSSPTANDGRSGKSAANGIHLPATTISADGVSGTWTTRHVPLLPKLQNFKISGLEGSKLARLIRHREKAGVRIPLHRYENEYAHARETYRIQHWIVSWKKGEDAVLDNIVQDGYLGLRVDTFEDDEDDDAENLVSDEETLSDDEEYSD